MAKNSVKTNRSATILGFNPDVYGAALAHIIKVENTEQGRRETVLGQAWLAGVGKLITCGHVVEPHMNTPGALIVTFPYSGNRYPINDIKLHPSYVKQPDGLVKFDAALLLVQLNEPELSARILPIVYEKALPSQSALVAVRYPVHLNQYSSALNPLAQSGRLLGPLRKHDDFHLLHDTALAPGDSGSPIFDNDTLVALHCGDTATLPGLNLPTTSIRLALWVDALRELGIDGVMADGTGTARSRSMVHPAALAAVFWIVFLLSVSGLWIYKAYPTLARYIGDSGTSKPITVSFSKPLNEYKFGETASLFVMAQAKYHIYLYEETGKDQFIRVFPSFKNDTHLDDSFYTIDATKSCEISQVGDTELNVDCNPTKFHLIALNYGIKRLEIDASYEEHEGHKGTMLDRSEEVLQARKLQKDHPNDVLELTFDSPVASKESYEQYRKQNASGHNSNQAPSNNDQGAANQGQKSINQAAKTTK